MDLLFGEAFFLDGFALRQWDDPNYGGTRVSFDKVRTKGTAWAETAWAASVHA